MDFDKEKDRLTTEISRLSKITEGLEKKLVNENFISKAPVDIVEQTKAQKGNLESQIDGLRKSLAAIS